MRNTYVLSRLEQRIRQALPRRVSPVGVILVEIPDPVGGYGAKGVGEIGLVPTAAAVAGALFAWDGIRRTSLPMSDAPAAAPSVPKSRPR